MDRWEYWAAQMGTWIISLRRDALEAAPSERPSIEAHLRSIEGYQIIERSPRALAIKCTDEVRAN